MDESREPGSSEPVSPMPPESTQVQPALASVPTDADPVRPIPLRITAPPPRRSWKGPAGLMAALALAFAWGALTHRELGTQTRVVSAPFAAAAVAGSEAPPGWIGDFAKAFCAADASHIALRIGPPLSQKAADIEAALASREWTCTETRYLGGGKNMQSEFYAYVTLAEDGDEQWWVFTVIGERVVGID